MPAQLARASRLSLQLWPLLAARAHARADALASARNAFALALARAIAITVAITVAITNSLILALVFAGQGSRHGSTMHRRRRQEQPWGRVAGMGRGRTQ